MINPQDCQSTAVLPAKLQLSNGVPESSRYGDLYFSRENGIEESRYVFLQGTGLPDAWRQRDQFVIAELGFGTGLNFLLTGQLWKETTEATQWLHYLSFEKHPFTKSDFETIQKSFSIAPELLTQYIEHYPDLVPGPHRIVFQKQRILLTVFLGDVAEWLPELEGAIDAWYLDGFAPAKNPEMWSESIFKEVAAHSHDGTRFSTFTAAGSVRRTLEAEGFQVEKFKGYGGKRESLKGVFKSRASCAARKKQGKSLLVIGGGISGCSIAYAAARRGIEVILLEKNSLAAGASGNPRGLILPYVSSSRSGLFDLYAPAFGYARQCIASLEKVTKEPIAISKGAFHIPANRRLERFVESELDHPFAQIASHRRMEQALGFTTTHRGPIVHYPDAVVVNPTALCRALVADEKIVVRSGADVHSIKQTEAGWGAFDASGALLDRGTDIVCASSVETTSFSQFSELPLNSVRGQLSVFPTPPQLLQMKQALCFDAYLLPPHTGSVLLGATYDHDREDTELLAESRELLLSKFTAVCPDIEFECARDTGRVAFRATTRDHMPIVGSPAIGLHCCVGLGSRGLVSGPLLGESLVSKILEEPPPLGRTVLQGISHDRTLTWRLPVSA